MAESACNWIKGGPIRAPLASAWVWLASAQAAYAQEGHGAHGSSIQLSDVFTDLHFWGAVVNFILLLLIFYWLGRKPVSKYLRTRREAVQQGLADAARLKAQAEAVHREYQDRLARLNEELERTKTEIRESAKQEKARILADAEARAQRARRDAELLIDQQMHELRQAVTREVVDAAVAEARKVLTDAMTSQDQERLAQQYVESLKARMQVSTDNGKATPRQAGQPERRV